MIQFFRKFIALESSSGILLLLATILALIISNSPWHTYYQSFFTNPFSIHWSHYQWKTTLFTSINEGLMAFFFLLVGLEIKNEMLYGVLNTRAKIMLPTIAATGGMIVPAIIYIGFSHSNKIATQGWAIPTATDIAFSLGVLSLLGKKIPASLKIFLTALAVFDDLAAIVIIAIFYGHHFSYLFLGCASIILFMLIMFNYFRLDRLWIYLSTGFLFWIFLLKSGLHATLAGVILAFTIPRTADLQKLIRYLHPWITFGILPLFAFANAGVALTHKEFNTLFSSVLLGSFFGLFLGKPLGILSFCWLATQFKLAELPEKVRWSELSGVAILCGIGFTISLFISALAFGTSHPFYFDSAKIGILIGSCLSGILGYAWLSFLKN